MRDFAVTTIFNALRLYLSRVGFVGAKRISLQNSRKAQERNRKSPRSFCHVVLGKPVIHCAMAAMGMLPDYFIAGLLLHEIAHILIHENGGDPELQVDEWILERVPEAGYRYGDITYTDTNRWREARNVEYVSVKFLKRIMK